MSNFCGNGQGNAVALHFFLARFRLYFPGATDRYRWNELHFQASTNLRDWTSLLTSNAVNGLLDFSDANASGFLSRFYRVC
jgi:hypothetical protein